MHLIACLHTHSHPRSFIQSASTGTEGSFCLSTICQHLYSIFTYSSCVLIICELLTIIYLEKTFSEKTALVSTTKSIQNIKNKLHAKPGRKTSFHFLYTTLPFVFKTGQTIISFHFAQMVCISKQKILLCKVCDFMCSLLLASTCLHWLMSLQTSTECGIFTNGCLSKW